MIVRKKVGNVFLKLFNTRRNFQTTSRMQALVHKAVHVKVIKRFTEDGSVFIEVDEPFPSIHCYFSLEYELRPGSFLIFQHNF
jgi:hypothetical protein